MDILVSVLILTAGGCLAWFYLRKPPLAANPRLRALVGDRPWRRLGAGICLLLSIMFVAGMHLLDAELNPKVFVSYWLVMLLLLLWLCVLAVKDVLFTRQVIARWKAHRDFPPPDDSPAPPSKRRDDKS